MTNYEIRKIQEVYIKLWQLDSRKPYIPIQSILHYFDHDYYGLIKNYFHKGLFNSSDFFVFVCFFSFFDTNQQIQLLLIMAKVYSNVIITREQVNTFFREYQSKKVLKESVIDNLTKKMDNLPNDTYLIKSFIAILKENTNFSSFLYQFKKEVVLFVFLPSDYQRINQRNTFYYENNTLKLKPPKEECCEYLHRVIFTRQPNPYYYDYFPMNSDIKDGKSNLLFMLKQSYGYSSRMESITNYQSNVQHTTSLKKTLKSFKCNEGISANITPSSPYSLGSVRLAPRTSVHRHKLSNNNINNVSSIVIVTKSTV